MNTKRCAAVAGTFYPAPPADLSAAVTDLLRQACPIEVRHQAPLKALIAPHAGYIYSGVIAAQCFSQLLDARSRIRRVVLIGPAHRVAVRGLALARARTFETPLGTIPVDEVACTAILKLPQVAQSESAHALEHALEVQLPFLQTVLNHFTLVPLLVGEASADEVAEVLELLWGGPQTLIVVSSDLSHFLPYNAAQLIDHDTTQHILALDACLTQAQACGATPINGLLLAAGRHALQVQLLGRCNSGDHGGDKHRVVGYGGFAFRVGNGHGG